MYRVITTLLARRLVSLVGDDGVGKSSLAAAVCTYIADRNLFEDGVVFVRVGDRGSHDLFLDALLQALARGHPTIAGRYRHAKAQAGAAPQSEDLTLFNEDLVCNAIGSLRVLLVIDNVDVLLHDETEAMDLKFFLGRLFERCNALKVLITATSTLGMRHVSGFGVVENCVSLGPLSLRSALRLYARLAPSLYTAAAKASFVNAMLPLKQMHVTIDSRELSVVAAQILRLVNDGHPAHIVKSA